MKRLILFATLATTIHAQDPFTYETSEALFSTGDFNSDSRADLIVVDKQDGTYTVGFAQAAGDGFDWSQRHPSGFASPSGLAVGVFDGSGVFVITAPEENRLTGFVLPDHTLASPPHQHIFPTGPASRSIAGFFLNGDTSTDYIAAGDYGTSGARYYAEGLSFGDDPEIFFTDTDTDEILRIWRLVPHPAYNATAVYIRGGSVWIDGVGSIGIGGFELTTVTASENTRLTYGHYGGSAFALPILYDHGQNSAHAVELIDIFGSIFWGNQTNLTFPKPLALLTTVNERLVALFTDESAATYDFDGTTLTHRSDLPGTYNLLAPIEGDAFLSVQGGVWQRWDASSAAATLTSITAGTFPTPGSPGNAASVSNIVFTDKEPFVDPTAEPIFIGKVRDWTTAATRIDRDWDVTALSQNAAGLGSPVSLPVDTDSPNSHFALVSQYAENISFRLLEPTAYGKPVSDITISPPSGTYPPPSGTPPIGLSITFSTSGAAGTPVILFRLAGSTVWQTYNPTHPPEIFTTTTIEAHAISAEGRTPTRRATYVFADPSALTPGSFIDADGDGLPDQWEDAFNAYDPLGDADGDGISNLTEYHDCTDPQDAHSSGAHPLVLEYEHLGGSLRLEWSIARPTAVLEGSDDLVTWSPITTGITTVAGKFRLDIPIGADPRGFFRLKQN